MINISGVIPALITPYDKQMNVNLLSLRVLVDRLIAVGVNGFFVCGSTAEWFLLSDEERKLVLETVTEQTNGRVPVIAHIGSISTKQAVGLAKHAGYCGASTIASIPPFYYKFSMDEITGYYEEIGQASSLPMVVYNIPEYTGVTITSDSLKKLREHCNIQGMKYTSGNLAELQKIHQNYPELSLLSGYDDLFCDALSIGVQGAIGSTFNIMGDTYIDIWSAFKKGNIKKAAMLQQEANKVTEVLVKTGMISSIKYLLTKSGINCGYARSPFARINKDQQNILDEVYEYIPK